ncbi:MAG: TIGR04282 family arsenosugar biosynthesis glycosyltransferase [Gemmatimonadetes bacterium]|nr:TIGR04282 family arsenosugar biosynthesis glycosyltransferase [Gemmatimonadota bacterium]
MSTCAVLFAKKPAPGAVKTRLQSHLSARDAARLYEALLLDCATALHATHAVTKVIAFAPADAEESLRTLLTPIGSFEYVPQSEGDLGQRMEGLMQWGFVQGAERVVLVGSDSPSLPAAYIDEGLALLREKEVVLGPSTDGGYYLVGRRKGESRIFQDVAWSTGMVLEQTLGRLGTQTLGLLPPWYDVDTPAEAGFLKVHLEALARAGSTQGQHSLAVLRDLALPQP